MMLFFWAYFHYWPSLIMRMRQLITDIFHCLSVFHLYAFLCFRVAFSELLPASPRAAHDIFRTRIRAATARFSRWYRHTCMTMQKYRKMQKLTIPGNLMPDRRTLLGRLSRTRLPFMGADVFIWYFRYLLLIWQPGWLYSHAASFISDYITSRHSQRLLRFWDTHRRKFQFIPRYLL